LAKLSTAPETHFNSSLGNKYKYLCVRQLWLKVHDLWCVLLSVQLTGLVVEKYSHSRYLIVTQVLSLTLHTFLHISVAMELKQSCVGGCGCVGVWVCGYIGVRVGGEVAPHVPRLLLPTVFDHLQYAKAVPGKSCRISMVTPMSIWWTERGVPPTRTHIAHTQSPEQLMSSTYATYATIAPQSLKSPVPGTTVPVTHHACHSYLK